MKTARLVFVSTPYASIECRDKDINYYAKQIEHQACSLVRYPYPLLYTLISHTSQTHLYDKECKHSLDTPKVLQLCCCATKNRISVISYQILKFALFGSVILLNQLLSCVIIPFKKDLKWL